MTTKKALLLLNMGGPNNLQEVKTFLNNMFNDPRIIQAPKIIRQLIAWLITYKRLKEATENYAHLGGKSPIISHTKKVVDALQSKIDADVFYVMRYTPPYTDEVLKSLHHYDKIHAIPLYPHFSSTTTLSSFDALDEAQKKLHLTHPIQTIDYYYNHPSYIASIVERIKEALQNDDPEEFELIFSAHGLPQSIIDRGDLYQRHIRYNVYYVRRALNEAGIHFYNTHLAYQSRLGPMEWIRPYLEEKLYTLKKKKVILYPIAFTIDNSETEFELEIEYRSKARSIGYEQYRVAKAPNEHPYFIETLADLYHQLEQRENLDTAVIETTASK